MVIDMLTIIMIIKLRGSVNSMSNSDNIMICFFRSNRSSNAFNELAFRRRLLYLADQRSIWEHAPWVYYKGEASMWIEGTH